MSSAEEYSPFTDDEDFDDGYHLDEDIDLGFSDIKAEKELKKDYEVEFKVLTMADIISTQENEINQVCNIEMTPVIFKQY